MFFVLLTPSLFHPNFGVFLLHQITDVGVSPSRSLKLFMGTAENHGKKGKKNTANFCEKAKSWQRQGIELRARTPLYSL